MANNLFRSILQILLTMSDEHLQWVHGLLKKADDPLWRKRAEYLLTKEEPQPLPTWKHLQIGQLKNGHAYLRHLFDHGFHVSPKAREIMEYIGFLEKKSFRLVAVTPAELGLEGLCSMRQIYEAALSSGLVLCPPHIGPALRVVFRYEFEHNNLLIGMAPIMCTAHELHIFRLEANPGKFWLSTYQISEGEVHDSRVRWIFCLPKE